MLQKVALAGALVHDPRLIILDEPLTGLDAGSARQVKDVLRQKVADGVTVIMTTHILEVAERMAERIGVLAGGRLIAEGTLGELRARIGREHHARGDLPRPGRRRKRRRGRRMSAAGLHALVRRGTNCGWPGATGVAMTTGGKRRRGIVLVARPGALRAGRCTGSPTFCVAPWIAPGVVADKQTLVLVTGTGACSGPSCSARRWSR